MRAEPGVPCYLAVARSLRSIADEFERRPLFEIGGTQ